jgi:hypothetical protein
LGHVKIGRKFSIHACGALLVGLQCCPFAVDRVVDVETRRALQACIASGQDRLIVAEMPTWTCGALLSIEASGKVALGAIFACPESAFAAASRHELAGLAVAAGLALGCVVDFSKGKLRLRVDRPEKP